MTVNYYFDSRYPGISATWLLVAFACIACLYLIVVNRSFHFSNKTSRSLPLSTHWLLLPLLGALLLGGALLFLPVVFSPDMQSYISASQAGARYYSYPPAGMLPVTSPVLYGPIWLSIVSLLVSISNHNPLMLTWLLRGIELITHLANTALIWAILARVAPIQRLPGTLLYAWNPLVLLELVGNGHYDGVVICLLLLAIWLDVRPNDRRGGGGRGEGWGRLRRPPEPVAQAIRLPPGTRATQASPPLSSSTPAPTDGSLVEAEWIGRDKSRPYEILGLILIGLAVSMNWLALVVAPLVVWFMARYRRKAGSTVKGFGWRALLVLVVVTIVYLPVWQGSTTFVAIISTINLLGLMHSLLALLAGLLNLLYTALLNLSHITTPTFAPIQPTSAADISIVASALFIFVLLYFREMGKARTFETLFTGLSIVMASYVALASTIFWPWYLIWIVWIVALRPFDIWSKTLLVCSCTALFYYPLLDITSSTFVLPLCIFGIPFVYFVGARILTSWQIRTIKTKARIRHE